MVLMSILGYVDVGIVLSTARTGVSNFYVFSFKLDQFGFACSCLN